MTRKNPPAEVALMTIAPLLPYLAAGVTIYFFGGRIATWIGSKIAGKSVEEFKADTSTVAEAIKTPLVTTAEVISFLTNSTVYISQAEQTAALAKIKAATVTKTYAVPYPNPQSQAEFRANMAAIDAALGKTSGH